MRVRLAAPRVWRPAVREWFAATGLKAGEARLASAMLSSLHNQHVGITPRLAGSLARAVLSREAPTPWSDALAALRRQLDGAASGEALLLRRSVSFALHDLAAPLIRAACDDLGEMILFAGDGLGADVQAAELDTYDAQLESTLRRLINEGRAPLTPLFWRERAHRLLSLSDHAPSPDITLSDAAILHRLQAPLRERHLRPLTMTTPQAQGLRDQRRTAVGADGVTLTRREDDLHHMRLSEYIYPRPIRLDRVLNTGYTIVKPPPQTVRQRDVLLLMLLPGDASSAFLKTCLADVALLVSRTLRETLGSHLRLIEGDAFGRARTFAADVDALSPYLPVTIPPTRTRDFRLLFLRSAGWLNRYLDASAPAYPPQPPPGPQPLDWARTVWRQHLDPLHEAPADAEALRRDDYQFVYALLCLPLAWRDELGEDQAESAVHDVIARDVDGFALTWVPPQIDAIAAWESVNTAGRWRSARDKLTLAQLAGALIDHWLDGLEREMSHV